MWSPFLVVAALAPSSPAPVVPLPNQDLETQESVVAAVLHGGDEGLRDRLRGASVLLHDAGGFLLADLPRPLESWLEDRQVPVQRLAQRAANEELYVVGARRADTLERIEASGARVLLHLGAQALVAATPQNAAGLRDLEPGRHLHAGLSRVRRTPMTPPRPFAPPGAGNNGGGYGPGAPDARIQAVVDMVDPQRLEQTVLALSAIPTRCAAGSGAIVARDQIVAQLAGFGYTPTLQFFSSSYSENVVAELPGTIDPDRIVVIGGHYDSIASSCSATSPGADDNATGTAGVIEAARVLAAGGPWEHTVRFVLYSAEEYGLVGSEFASQQSASAGEDILAMINTDMSAYRAPGDTRDVDFVTNNTTPALRAFCDTVGALYVPSWASNTGSLSGGTSDHQSYFEDGFPAVFFFEDVDQYSPYIHSSGDAHPQSTNDFALSEMVVKGIVATAATLIDPVDLEIAHTPLADTEDDPGPYSVACQVQSLTGANVTGVELHYAVDGGAWTSVAMALQGSDWVAGIPASGSPVTLAYYLTASDDQGGFEDLPEGADLGVPPFSFFVGVVTEHYFNDFEAASDQGWTHGQDATQDDWQHGVANGKAGDATAAFSGTRLWGNDLGPSGWNGEYQPDVSNWLRSPAFDLSAVQNVYLRYQRWLTVEDAVFDQAQIKVDGVVVWQNETGAHTIDTAWTRHTVDVAAQAAGDASVQVEFRLMSDGGLQFGGWNLDDFSVVSLEPIGCPAPANYCTTSPNSVGSGAVMGSNGETSVAANALELQISAAPPNQFGLFFYGTDQVVVPLGNGVRCVGGSLYRLPVVQSGALGDAQLTLDLGDLPAGGDILVGSVWNFQFWYRDPAAGGANYNFSDGLEVTFCQ